MSSDEIKEASQYGFKRVDAENVLSPDPLMAALATREGDVIRPMTYEDVARPLLRIHLNDDVPKEVRRAFLFPLYAMCYAFWYYPLTTLGAQQILRVADLASERAGHANGLQPHRNFRPRIGQLRAAGVIQAAREDRWNQIVDMRNRVTHPGCQQTWGFAQTVQVVRMIADEINALRWPPSEVQET